jgi:hypothetical protein
LIDIFIDDAKIWYYPSNLDLRIIGTRLIGQELEV